eukprot:1049968-Alexandrium_andersonii.AAC.1
MCIRDSSLLSAQGHKDLTFGCRAPNNFDVREEGRELAQENFKKRELTMPVENELKKNGPVSYTHLRAHETSAHL